LTGGVGVTAPRLIRAVVTDEAGASDPAPVPWWSFGKTVLAAAALRLVAEGRLCLDEPVGRRPFTLRHLLQHRAGLPEYGRLAAYHADVAAGGPPWPRDRLLREVAADTLVFEPGQGWAYSNVGYLLVRDLVEEATGLALGVALDRLVLGPLGVAGVRVVHEPADLAATAWGNAAGYHPGWVYHGLLIGPAASAALLLHRLLGGSLLPEALRSAMLAAHPVGGPVPGRPWRMAGYGLGLMIGVGDTGALYVGHTGGGPGSTAAVYQCVPGRTAAAFAPMEEPAAVERCAMGLACGGQVCQEEDSCSQHG